MSRTMESAKVVRVTQALADEFANMASVVERPVGERRLMVYERIMKAGEFRPCTWGKAYCKETGQWYRVNGQHTSVLYSRLLPELVEPPYVTLEIYQCETLDDVAKLWATYDNKLQSRSVSDINHSFASVVPELKDVRRRVIDLCVSGIWQHSVGGSRGGCISRTADAPERAEVLLDETEFVLWVDKMIGSGVTNGHRHLCRAGVVAAMYATWKKAKGASTTFWESVRDETGATPDCPDRKLSRWLLTTISHAGGDRPQSKKADSREMYVRGIYAWNAWRRGEKLQHIKYHPTAKCPSAQ